MTIGLLFKAILKRMRGFKFIETLKITFQKVITGENDEPPRNKP